MPGSRSRTGPVGSHVADHLDDDRLNNDPANLVPSCIPCNTHWPAVA